VYESTTILLTGLCVRYNRLPLVLRICEGDTSTIYYTVSSLSSATPISSFGPISETLRMFLSFDMTYLNVLICCDISIWRIHVSVLFPVHQYFADRLSVSLACLSCFWPASSLGRVWSTRHPLSVSCRAQRCTQVYTSLASKRSLSCVDIASIGTCSPVWISIVSISWLVAWSIFKIQLWRVGWTNDYDVFFLCYYFYSSVTCIITTPSRRGTVETTARDFVCVSEGDVCVMFCCGVWDGSISGVSVV
jgi:hypothetical protein